MVSRFRGLGRALCALAVLSFALPDTAHAQFALCPPVAGLPYGLTALKFPAAWNKTCGTAYVAIVDHGIQLGHASLSSETSGNVRTHLSRDCIHVPRHIAIGPAGSDALCATPGVTFDSLDAPVTVATLEEPVTPGRGHGTHVAGIVGARPGGNVVGGCRNCSLLLFVRRDDPFFDPNNPESFTPGRQTRSALTAAYSTGAQVVNLSAGNNAVTGRLGAEIVEVLKRDIVFIAASGNSDKVAGNTAVEYPANQSGILAIGGLREDAVPLGVSFWPLETVPVDPRIGGSGVFGSASGAEQFLVAPARSVRSTFFTGGVWVNTYPSGLNCTDPQSTGFADCSGTSMSAPHVTAIVGLVRSANPLLTAAQVKIILIYSSTNPDLPSPGYRNLTYGYGVPDAEKAVTSALGGAGVVNRKTPLFALHSTAESNHIFTVVPQMAMAAIEGRLPPRPVAQNLSWPEPATMNLYAPVGTAITSYASFTPSPCPPDYPRCTPIDWGTPRASASVLTTPRNPAVGGLELLPLYRMSWRCNEGAGTGNSICGSVPSHVVHFYTTSDPEVANKLVAGFHVDGIEGFVYPPTQTPPAGAVKLCRKYNASRDDFILFAGTGTGASACSSIPADVAGTGAGTYGDALGTDFIGYAYPPGPPEAIPNPMPPASIIVSSGTPQSAQLGAPFGLSLAALVRDQNNTPIAGVNVTFTAPASGATATPATQTVPTNLNGIATVSVSATGSVGTYNVNATVPGVAQPASFVLTNQPGPPALLTLWGGTPQTALLNAAFTFPLQALVRDAYGNAISGVSVAFSAPSSGPSATLSSGNATTGANGVATVTATASGVVGTYSVTASVSGLGTVSFQLTNQALAASSMQVVSGSGQSANVSAAFPQALQVIVRDQLGNPFPGATVSFSVLPAGPGAVLSPASAVTGANGMAAISASANGTAGTYLVYASAGGGAATTSFTLTNVAVQTCTPGSYIYESTLPGAYTFGPDMVLPVGWGATFSFAVPAGQTASLSIYQHTMYGYYWMPDLVDVAVSKCKGDFNVVPECKMQGGRYSIVSTVTTPVPGGCVLEPDTTYYFNVRTLACGEPNGNCGLRGYRNN